MTVMDTIREAPFGQLLRLLTNNRVLLYPEERDPDIWYSYIITDEIPSTPAVCEGKHSDPVDSAQPPATDTAPDIAHGQPEDSLRETDVARHPFSGMESKNSLTTRRISPEHGERAVKTKIDLEKDVIFIGWAEGDPANPLNWSTAKKWTNTALICLLTIAIYIGGAIYSPGIPDIMIVFGVSQVAATIGLTLFVFAYGVGPMLWGPMSEIPQLGLNWIYIPTLIIFVVLQVPTALSINLGMLLVFRFLTGFFASPVLANGGASISHMFSARKRAQPLIVWAGTGPCGPVLGPIVGGFAAQAKGWAWTIWELAWLSGFTLIIIFFFLPETSHANILYRRTRRLRRLTGLPNLRCKSEFLTKQHNHLLHDIVITTARGFALNFQEPIVFVLNLYMCLVYGLLYAWFESFSVVFGEIYGFSLPIEGLSFIGILVGSLIAIPPYCAYVHYVLGPKFNEKAEIKPEERMPFAFIGAFLIPVALFIFGWTGRASVPWIAPIIGSALFSMGALYLFVAVLNYLSDAYPTYAASVLAGNAFMRSSFGAVFPLFATQMYHKLGVGWASTLLALLAVVFIPIPFVLYKFGEKIRLASPRARHDL